MEIHQLARCRMNRTKKLIMTLLPVVVLGLGTTAQAQDTPPPSDTPPPPRRPPCTTRAARATAPASASAQPSRWPAAFPALNVVYDHGPVPRRGPAGIHERPARCPRWRPQQHLVVRRGRLVPPPQGRVERPVGGRCRRHQLHVAPDPFPTRSPRSNRASWPGPSSRPTLRSSSGAGLAFVLGERQRRVLLLRRPAHAWAAASRTSSGRHRLP